MKAAASSEQATFVDHFEDARPPGSVIGSLGSGGVRRGGVDVESLISIDHGSLRLRPLARPGWAREGLAYGPYSRVPGLTLSARVLNGHNSSQTYYFPESGRQRLRRLVSDARKRKFRRPLHFENLAVGWFTSEAPKDPLASGNALVMHAANRDNGELWAAVGHREMRAVLGVQNLDIVYTVCLRAQGAMYYVTSTPGAAGLGDFPFLRPVALDVQDDASTVYAGVQQRILGEVGYRVDTRVGGVGVGVVDGWSAWYGSADVADRLTGSGPLAGSDPEVGAGWKARSGHLARSSLGATGDGEATIASHQRLGLVHTIVTPADRSASAAIVFRGGPRARWVARVDGKGVALIRVTEEAEELVASADAIRLLPGREHRIQLTDDGTTIGFHVDGRLAFDTWTSDGRDGHACEVGLRLAGNISAREFEAHPSCVPLPVELDVGEPWTFAGHDIVIEEQFDSTAADLDGVSTSSGARAWERTFGKGTIELCAGLGAAVRASTKEPNPDRTLYTIEWTDPTCADIELEMIPPGTGRHQGERCRGGIVFWQDPENYLIANIFLDDVYDGASVSTFYHLGGHEDMYDAVWALVWPVRWGQPCRLRVAFDGHRFLAWHDGRPVLQRALTDVYPATPNLRINRVGIVVNREWGDDTGTRFTFFRGLAGGGAG